MIIFYITQVREEQMKKTQKKLRQIIKEAAALYEKEYKFSVSPSPVDGVGLFSNCLIPRSKVLFPAFGLRSDSQEFIYRRLAGQPIAYPPDIFMNKMTWVVNHKKDSNCSVVKENNVWFIVSNREIPANTEIFINYKDLPSFMERKTEGFIE
jgi:hypothetical protein